MIFFKLRGDLKSLLKIDDDSFVIEKIFFTRFTSCVSHRQSDAAFSYNDLSGLFLLHNYQIPFTMNTITTGIKICFYESHIKASAVFFFYDNIIKLMKNYAAKEYIKIKAIYTNVMTPCHVTGFIAIRLFLVSFLGS